MVVCCLSSFGSLNSESDEGIASTAAAHQVLREALVPFLTQSDSPTGIYIDGPSGSQLLVCTVLTNTRQNIPSANPAAANDRWLLHAVTHPNLSPAHLAAHSL